MCQRQQIACIEPRFKRDQVVNRHGCIIAVMASGGCARHASGYQGLFPSHIYTSQVIMTPSFKDPLSSSNTRLTPVVIRSLSLTPTLECSGEHRRVPWTIVNPSELLSYSSSWHMIIVVVSPPQLCNSTMDHRQLVRAPL